MGVAEELLRVRTEVTGTEAVARLQKELAEVKRQIGDNRLAAQLGMISDQQYAEASDRLAASKARLSTELARANQQLAQTQRAGGNASMAILNLSRAGQDFAQGGFAGALNNVEGIAMALPGKLGQLAGPLTIVATIGYVAYTQWDNLMGLIGQRVKVPEPDTSTLDSARDKLKSIQDQLDAFRKRGKITFGEMDTYKDLQRSEAEVKQLIKDKQVVEHLKELRSDAQQALSKAFQDALGESDAKKALAVIEKQVKSAAVPAVKKNFDTIVGSINRGNLEAYDALIQVIEGAQGADAKKLAANLKKFRPLSPKEKVLEEIDSLIQDKWTPAMKEQFAAIQAAVKDGTLGEFDKLLAAMAQNPAHREIAQQLQRKRAKGGDATDIFKLYGELIGDYLKSAKADQDKVEALNQQGRDVQEETFKQLMETTTKAVEGAFGKPLEDVAVFARANGIHVLKESAELEKAIREAALRINPALKNMPLQLAELVAGVRIKVQESVDQTINKLAEEERITKEQAAQRLERRRQAETEGKFGRQAEDFFADFLQNKSRATTGKGLNPTQLKQQVEQMRESFRGMGLSEQAQMRVGAVLNGDRLGQVPEVLNALQNRGFNQQQSWERLPDVMYQLFKQNDKGTGVEQAADRVLQQVIRNQAMLANRQARQGNSTQRALSAAQQVGDFLQLQSRGNQNAGPN